MDGNVIAIVKVKIWPLWSTKKGPWVSLLVLPFSLKLLCRPFSPLPIRNIIGPGFQHKLFVQEICCDNWHLYEFVCIGFLSVTFYFQMSGSWSQNMELTCENFGFGYNLLCYCAMQWTHLTYNICFCNYVDGQWISKSPTFSKLFAINPKKISIINPELNSSKSRVAEGRTAGGLKCFVY